MPIKFGVFAISFSLELEARRKRPRSASDFLVALEFRD
jgi:hypothetical protein